MKNIKFILTSLLFNLKDFFKLDINFWVILGISIIKQLLFVLAWMFFFNQYDILEGWHFSEMLLMYGIVSVGVGITEIFFYGLRHIPELVENNQLDIYLLQPKNLVLNIAVSKADISAFGDLATGLILVYWSGHFLSSLPVVLISFLISTTFMFSLYLFLGSWSLYLKNSKHFIKEVYQNSLLLATQPNSSYKGAIKILTLTLIPVAYMSFYPIEYILNNNIKCLFYGIIGTISFLSLSFFIFYRGLKRYESGYTFVERN